MGIKMLRRRLERLEKSLGLTEQAHDEFILCALDRMSAEDVQLLVDAAMARRRGRPLTERESAAKRAYRAAVSQCRSLGGEVTSSPFCPFLIDHVAFLVPSLENHWSRHMEAICEAWEARDQGLELTAPQLAALQNCHSLLEAQYRRIGFGSRAEFIEWYGKRKPRDGPNHSTWSDFKLEGKYGDDL